MPGRIAKESKKIITPEGEKERILSMKKLMKKVAAVGLAGAMMVGGAMTAMAAGTYFYVYEDGVFGAARMGQECVASVEVDGDIVILNLQASDYDMGIATFEGVITDAFIDADGDLTYDEGVEESIFYGDTIEYDQKQLKKTVEGTDYANFCIEVTVQTTSGTVVHVHNPQSVYVPMQ